MIQYGHPLSPYGQRVRIMLREKGVAFETRVPDGLWGPAMTMAL